MNDLHGFAEEDCEMWVKAPTSWYELEGLKEISRCIAIADVDDSESIIDYLNVT